MLNVLFFSHYPTYSGMDGGNNILLVTAKGLSSNKYKKIVISPGRGALSEHLGRAGIEERIFEYDCGQFNGKVLDALKNDVRSFEYAHSIGAKTMGIIGFFGGKVRELSDHSIYIPSYNYGIVEDIQLAIGHMISQEIKSNVKDGRYDG